MELAIHTAGNFGMGEFGELLLSQGSININFRYNYHYNNNIIVDIGVRYVGWRNIHCTPFTIIPIQ